MQKHHGEDRRILEQHNHETLQFLPDKRLTHYVVVVAQAAWVQEPENIEHEQRQKHVSKLHFLCEQLGRDTLIQRSHHRQVVVDDVEGVEAHDEYGEYAVVVVPFVVVEEAEVVVQVVDANDQVGYRKGEQDEAVGVDDPLFGEVGEAGAEEEGGFFAEDLLHAVSQVDW